MFEEVKRYIKDNEMLRLDDKIVVGVSGGADSTALLEVLYLLREEYRLSLYVVHINHGIRAEAAEDARFVEKLCKDRDILFYLFKENIPQLAKTLHLSEEEAGRKYRYQCFGEVMREVGSCKLAVAHHMDDQAETVLFHMVRGTDLSGMSGMLPVSPMAPFTDNVMKDAYIIRPFLKVRRSQITGWLSQKGMSWKEDVTNGDDNYARNRIRNKVINELNEVNEGASLHIAEFAALCAEYDDYIGRQAEAFIKRYAVTESLSDDEKEDSLRSIKIRRKPLLEEDKVISYRAIYEMLIRVCGAKKDITREHINAIYDLIKKQSGKELSLPYGTKAEISYDHLILKKACEEQVKNNTEYTISVDELNVGEEYQIIISPDKKLVYSLLRYEDDSVNNDNAIKTSMENFQKNYTKYFDCDTIKDTLHIRYPRQEDYFIYDIDGHRKSLSKLMKDMRIPKNERMCQPVLASGDEILWVIGKRRCEDHRLKESTRRVLKVEYMLLFSRGQNT